MTSAPFDAETAARLDAIQTNPNPRRPWRVVRWWCTSVAWGKSLNREAAFDSVRNVLMVVGAGTVLGDFATMKLWLVAPMIAVAGAVWYIDYTRHF